MRLNLSHPTLLNFIDNVNQIIISNTNFTTYFDSTNEIKMNTQVVVHKLIKSSIKLRIKISDEDLKKFIILLKDKNEEIENYECAQILFDIIKNFDIINESSKPQKRQSKVIKTDKKINDD